VLHPDEFMFALNPEAMNEWATSILGEDYDPTGALEQLTNGDFLDSLYTVREALRSLPERTYVMEVEEDGELLTVEIRANTWITHLEWDTATQAIRFRTHGPPEGSIDVTLAIPDELLSYPFVVEVDGQSQELTASQELTSTTLDFGFAQGPHQVEVREQ
jgi:hypothetical protein